MGKITEGRKPEPTPPKTATHFDGEQPDTNIRTQDGKHSSYPYTPKPEKQTGDSGKG